MQLFNQQYSFVPIIFNQLFGFINQVAGQYLQRITEMLIAQMKQQRQRIYKSGFLNISQQTMLLMLALLVNYEYCFEVNSNLTLYYAKDIKLLLQTVRSQTFMQYQTQINQMKLEIDKLQNERPSVDMTY